MKRSMNRRTDPLPRVRCSLPCIVKKGTKRVRARLLDVSEGGLCVAASVRFRHKMTVKVVIDDPRHGPIEVEAVVWHERRFSQPSSGRKGWATGMVLSKAGPDFQALVSPGSVWEKPAEDVLAELREHSAPVPSADQTLAEDDSELDSGAPSVFRVRVKAVGTPRVRTLTLSAPSEAAVREAVLSDLEGEWQVLDVEVEPSD